jgi:RNA polymerase sigma factor (sigma-70 family)
MVSITYEPAREEARLGNGHGGAAPRLTPEGTSERDGDNRLLQRCRAGDDAAWTELVGRYERLVYSIAMREGLSPEDAHDTAQLVFEALVKTLGSVQSADSLGAWLAAVTRRQAWRIRDRSARERPALLDAAGQAEPATGTHGADPIAEIDRAVTLYRGLQELGEPCRSLLLSLYFDPAEPSYHEVALRLGRPTGSIGPTRARCLDRLREVLGGSWP